MNYSYVLVEITEEVFKANFIYSNERLTYICTYFYWITQQVYTLNLVLKETSPYYINIKKAMWKIVF